MREICKNCLLFADYDDGFGGGCCTITNANTNEEDGCDLFEGCVTYILEEE